MSRWKRLEEMEQKLSDMSADEIEGELPYWKQHLKTLSGPAHKGAMKRIHILEAALQRKRSEEAS